MSILLLLLGSLATPHAAQEDGSGFSTACAVNCRSTGYRIEVLHHEDVDKSIVRMWPLNITEYETSATHHVDDHYMGVQTLDSPLPWGPYCDVDGYFISGGVWRHTEPSPWSYVETPELHTLVDCDSMSHLRSLLNTYGIGDDPIPTNCRDFDCGVGGGNGTGPDTEFEGSRDIIEQIMDADGNWGDEDWGGGIDLDLDEAEAEDQVLELLNPPTSERR